MNQATDRLRSVFRPGAEHDPAFHHQVWRSADFVKRVSDRIVGVGPFGLGLDGVLAWVPGVGSVYSLVAGGFLLFQGVRAHARPGTLARMASYIMLNTASSGVPVVGWTFDTFFPGHLMAATALQKDIEDRHGAPPDVPAERWTRKKPRVRTQ